MVRHQSTSERVARRAGVCKGKKGFSFAEDRKRRATFETPRKYVRELMVDEKFTDCVKFLRSTGVGKVKQGVVLRGQAP